ncbi:hypothetical protein GALMADRAFT_139234 [Galerina marginata CBS 339.88]|uniref:Uncharacterized protein n=1 Tax=Galerina marginata (strain CBS 339.88) TaxID=685588 RepID=A0A067TBE1_GALM3|nr:hypothetical protein GALMADRAFT_139234 [Galerina marginata CBS 339.88]
MAYYSGPSSLSTNCATVNTTHFPGCGSRLRPRPPAFFAGRQKSVQAKVPQYPPNPYRGATAATLLASIQAGWLPGFQSEPSELKVSSNPYAGADAASLLSSIQSGWIPCLHSRYEGSRCCASSRHLSGSSYSSPAYSFVSMSHCGLPRASSPDTSSAEDVPIDVAPKAFVAAAVDDILTRSPSLLATGSEFERRETSCNTARNDAKPVEEGRLSAEASQQDGEDDTEDEDEQEAISRHRRIHDANTWGIWYRKKRGVKRAFLRHPFKFSEAGSRCEGYEGEDEDEYGHLSLHSRLSLRSRRFEAPWDLDEDEGAKKMPVEYPLHIRSFRNENRIRYTLTYGSETTVGDKFGAKRVRHLVIHDGLSYPLRKVMNVTVKKHEPSLQRLLALIKANWTRTCTRHDGEIQSLDPNYIDDLQEILSGLTSVTTLELGKYVGCNPDPSTLTVLHSGWTTFGSGLTNLIFNFIPEELTIMLPPHTKLVQLQMLTIQIITLVHASDADQIARLEENLLPFLETHRDVLRSLTLNFEGLVDMSSLIASLPYMPFLSSFCLIQVLPAPFSHLYLDFFVGSNLFPDPAVWFFERFIGIPFPQLTSLSLKFPDLFRELPEQVIPYLQYYLPTLTSLELSHYTFLDEDVARFLLPHICQHLRHLHLNISSLTRNLLRLFATNLPNLHSLSLGAAWNRFHAFDIAYLYYEDVNGVYLAVPQITFPDWNLDSLRIFPSDAFPNKRLAFYAKALLTTIPRLQYFCGVERGEILNLPLKADIDYFHGN